jgi:mono/diheme cytochrome c family protein
VQFRAEQCGEVRRAEGTCVGDGEVAVILKVIRDGVADKGMPPWGPVLKKEELYAVSAYIL